MVRGRECDKYRAKTQNELSIEQRVYIIWVFHKKLLVLLILTFKDASSTRHSVHCLFCRCCYFQSLAYCVHCKIFSELNWMAVRYKDTQLRLWVSRKKNKRRQTSSTHTHCIGKKSYLPVYVVTDVVATSYSLCSTQRNNKKKSKSSRVNLVHICDMKS